MMITYRSKKLEKTLNDDRLLIKVYGSIAKKIKQRHDDLKDAKSLQDIRELPQLGLHQLKGSRKEDWAITVKKNWRLCFQLLEDTPSDDDGRISYLLITNIEIISVEDYH